MKVLTFAGFSGAGKTTLMIGVLAALKAQGLRVSVVKHARHGFDVDTPGKDTWRHREAGAFEVVVASTQRLALLREFEQPCELTVHQMLAQLDGGVDWVLVEGFRDCDLLKLEVWRAATGQRVRYPDDDFITAVATDSPQSLPVPTGLPVLDLNDPQAVAQWMLSQQNRFQYQPELYA